MVALLSIMNGVQCKELERLDGGRSSPAEQTLQPKLLPGKWSWKSVLKLAKILTELGTLCTTAHLVDRINGRPMFESRQKMLQTWANLTPTLLIPVLLHLVVPDPRRPPAQRVPEERDRDGAGQRQADAVQRQQVAHGHRHHLRLVHPALGRRLRKFQVNFFSIPCTYFCIRQQMAWLGFFSTIFLPPYAATWDRKRWRVSLVIQTLISKVALWPRTFWRTHYQLSFRAAAEFNVLPPVPLHSFLVNKGLGLKQKRMRVIFRWKGFFGYQEAWNSEAVCWKCKSGFLSQRKLDILDLNFCNHS